MKDGLKVVDLKRNKPSECHVKIDDINLRFTEFIVAGHNEESGLVEILLDADALTILQASLLLKQAADKALEMLEPELREEVIKTANWAVGDNVIDS